MVYVVLQMVNNMKGNENRWFKVLVRGELPLFFDVGHCCDEEDNVPMCQCANSTMRQCGNLLIRQFVDEIHRNHNNQINHGSDICPFCSGGARWLTVLSAGTFAPQFEPANLPGALPPAINI